MQGQNNLLPVSQASAILYYVAKVRISETDAKIFLTPWSELEANQTVKSFEASATQGGRMTLSAQCSF